MAQALITGGGGFLGGALARDLKARGWEVRTLQRGAYPELEAAGIETRAGDLCDAEAVRAACAGVDVVFHVAARVGYHGPAREYEAVNVGGTQHVIDGCRAEGVGRLVFTSTPSVVHDRQGSDGVDESAPYPARFVADYPRTKAEAERRVLAANDASLRTVSLRPRGIWGPGDTQLFPRLVEWRRTGQLKRIGRGDPLQDFTYIDNCVHAHRLAAERLAEAPEVVGGKAYFITDGEPTGCWTMIERVLACAGLTGPERRVPTGAARVAAGLMEGIWRVGRLRSEPRLTRFKLDVLTQPCWFRIDAARADLGYEPQVTQAEGLERLRASAAQA